jgi:hypothetical protein
VVRGAFVHPFDGAFDACRDHAAVIATRVPLWDLHARTPPPGEECSSNEAESPPVVGVDGDTRDGLFIEVRTENPSWARLCSRYRYRDRYRYRKKSSWNQRFETDPDSDCDEPNGRWSEQKKSAHAPVSPTDSTTLRYGMGAGMNDQYTTPGASRKRVRDMISQAS